MKSLTKPRQSVKVPVSARWLSVPQGGVGLCLFTNSNGEDQVYQFSEVLADRVDSELLFVTGFAFTKEDGTTHHVCTEEVPWRCDCPDYLFRKEGRGNGTCKHCISLCMLLDQLDQFEQPQPGYVPV